MTQAAFSSRVLNASRVALAAVDTDYWVMDKGPSMIHCLALEMTGGQTLATTDAYSHAWFYYNPALPLNGLGTSTDTRPETDVSNVTTGTGLVWGTVVTTANKRCTTNGSSIDALKEITNTGQASSDAPNPAIASGQNSESQLGFNVRGVKDRDGAVIQFSMRTAIAIGGGAETPFLAKLRFPKPHAKPVAKFPMPRLRAGGVGRR
jgi:hypothetical protein